MIVNDNVFNKHLTEWLDTKSGWSKADFKFLRYLIQLGHENETQDMDKTKITCPMGYKDCMFDAAHLNEVEHMTDVEFEDSVQQCRDMIDDTHGQYCPLYRHKD